MGLWNPPIKSIPVSFLVLMMGCAGTQTLPPISELLIIDKSGDKGFQPHKVYHGVRTSVLIGLVTESSHEMVQSEGPVVIEDVETKFTHQEPAGELHVEAKKGQVTLNGQPAGRKVRIKALDHDGTLQWKGRSYRGFIRVVVNSESKVNLINELNVDSYLKGVLPREVITTWPEEALKAQAVASRTYLVSHLGKHKKDGFDLCSKVHCQVYGGMSKEHPKTSQAVDETRGEIRTYNGKAVNAFFHANCGGSTEKVQAVWGSSNQPYLPARKCGYGKGAPWYEWSRTIDNTEILSSLKKGTEVKGTKLKRIKVKKKSQSSRAEVITIQTNKGTYFITGNAFRMALHPEKIRSTLWTKLVRLRNGYRFEGQGWGHGVGMCQWGAKGQSDLNRKYQTILNFYYPNTSLQVWKR